VLVNGELVYRDGEPEFLDPRSVVAEARRSAESLLRRLTNND
jgi:hypothetical protein